jgi:protein tyrosine/serine phosphatase
LRFITSDRKLLKGTGLRYEHINTTTLSTDTKDVIRFLKIATNAEQAPAFVHCHCSAERTGIMCAAYRIVVQNWTKEEAIEEMTKGRFTSHTIKKNLLKDIRKMDVDELRLYSEDK